MTAIIKGSTSISEILQTESFQHWAVSNIPYVKTHRDEGGPGVDVYQLMFGFRKIHIGDLAKGRYKFILREPGDNFVVIHREVGGDVSGFMSWPSAKKAQLKPHVRLSYVVENDNEREAMETFLEDYFTHCEDAESKFERACFDTSSSWAKEQCCYNLISKPQLMVIHEMDHTLGKFKKPWRDPYGKNAKSRQRYTMVSASEKCDTFRGSSPELNQFL